MFEPVKCPPGCAYAMSCDSGPEGVHCGFILYTGRPRGCDPGPGCNQYRKKKRPVRAALRIRKAGPKFTWDVDAGKRMWLEGKTDREIADALGVKRETVGNLRRKKWMKEK